MAPNAKTAGVALIGLALAATLALALHAASPMSRRVTASAAEPCAPIPPTITFIGPAMTLSQVEAQSLAEVARSPAGVPRVPFGHLHQEWLDLRRLARHGDTVHEYRTAVTGGHLILRGQCLVGQLEEWIQ